MVWWRTSKLRSDCHSHNLWANNGAICWGCLCGIIFPTPGMNRADGCTCSQNFSQSSWQEVGCCVWVRVLGKQRFCAGVASHVSVLSLPMCFPGILCSTLPHVEPVMMKAVAVSTSRGRDTRSLGMGLCTSTWAGVILASGTTGGGCTLHLN